MFALYFGTLYFYNCENIQFLILTKERNKFTQQNRNFRLFIHKSYPGVEKLIRKLENINVPAERWAPPGLIIKDRLRILTQILACKRGMVETSGQVLYCVTSLHPNPFMVQKKMMRKLMKQKHLVGWKHLVRCMYVYVFMCASRSGLTKKGMK